MEHQQKYVGRFRVGKAQRFLLSALTLFGVLACTNQLWPGADKRPQQGWFEGFGPVVSHENFSLDCMLCHTGKDWQTLRSDFEFDHLAETGVPLEGAHSAAQCLRCHNDRGPVDRFAAQGCSGCHEDVHEGKQGKNCQDCHGQESWNLLGTIMDHARTRFPLVGAHAGTACRQCHQGIEVGNMAPLDVACESCHGGLEATVVTPDHTALGWVQGCNSCHQPTTWGGQGFIHTGFPLTGGHAQADCNQCHAGGVFGGAARGCVDCHQTEYDSTSDPNHMAAGFPTDCRVCHNAFNWNDAVFNHSTFAITGAHTEATCTQCHTGGVFQGLPSSCVDCHQSDYNATNDPNHASAGFSSDCVSCHNTNTWSNATFDHSIYPLTGAHQQVDCAQCHVGGVYAGTSQNCSACHQDDYNATINPNHQTQGFSTQCQDCHNTNLWAGANFTHDSFPLTGAHSSANCVQCHIGGVFAGTPSNCVDCHLADYQGTTDPDHQSQGFSTACQSCHGTTRWSGATFQHDFPINSGRHSGFACNECHLTSGSNDFSCIHCHAHRESRMNSEHGNRQGYSWTTAACYNCHSDGRAHDLIIRTPSIRRGPNINDIDRVDPIDIVVPR